MFDIGWTEILIIAVVAIIVVGPKDLPRMLRSLGRYAGQLRRTAGEFRSQFDDAIRESELDELRSTLSDVTDLNPINQIKDSVNETMAPLKQTVDNIKSGIEAPQAARDDVSEDSAAKKKSPAKPQSKPRAKASAGKSGG